MITKDLNAIKEQIYKLFSNKVFKICFIIHIVYVCAVLIFAIFNIDEIILEHPFSEIDFVIFYDSPYNLIFNISDLYLRYASGGFRYFPLSAILFLPLRLFSLEVSYYINIFSNFLVNFLNILLIIKISKENLSLPKELENSLIKYCGFGLLALDYLPHYSLGQTCTYVAFFLLLSLYYFEKKEGKSFINNILCGLFFTIATLLKPLVLIILPFLVVQIEYKKIHVNIKKSLQILSSFILIYALNIFILVKYNLLSDFLDINTTGITTNFNNSLSNLLSIVLQIDAFPLFIALCGGLLGIILFVLYTRKIQIKYSIFYFFIALVIGIISYIESWVIYNVLLIPFVLLFLINCHINGHPKIEQFKKIWFVFFAVSTVQIPFIFILKFNPIMPIYILAVIVYSIKELQSK